MFYEQDTIAAISTAMGNAGIGIVRISGPQAIAAADRVYRSKSGKRLAEQKANTIHYGYIKEGDELIDEVLVMLMKAPHTYTGEDTVEIDCHGGMLPLKKVLQEVLHAGVRAAEPGEFTKRAFLNGRIDLSQAEAVMDVISAGSEYALKNSLGQLQGSVSRRVQSLREVLLYEIAYIESALDDPEHISLEGYPEQLSEKLRPVQQETEQLLSTADQGSLIREGIRTVILGKPNAGKSSLLNELSGREKAIVTDIAGTTRDILEDTVDIGGIVLRLLDTAGIRESGDVIEQIGVERALQQAEDADLLLFVVDGSVPLDENDERILELIRHRRALVLLNKNDRELVLSEELLAERSGAPVFSISARTGRGIGQLKEKIRNMFFEGDISFDDQVLITSMRHVQALQRCRDSLALVQQSIAAGMPEDFFSIDLTDAYEALSSILGEAVGEDVVNEIFSRFCTGK